MALSDKLAAETADNLRVTNAAATGASLTGLSGRQTDMGPDAMFGAPQQAQPAPRGLSSEPIAAERVSRLGLQNMGGDSIDALIAADPALANRARRVAVAERKPFGAQEQQLAAEPRHGYRRYWFSDLPGRIKRAKEAGYEHVTDDVSGEPISRITDKSEGRGRNSYLMEIPLQWYQEDMAKQAAALDRLLTDIRKGRYSATGDGADRETTYVPKQGIKITGR